MRAAAPVAGLLTMSLAFALPAAQAGRKVSKLAAGVYAIEHAAGPFQSGNTTVIIGERQVFVVDSCFLPSEAREDLALIRQWTAKPVAFVLNTHFHNDHNFGNSVYLQAFPAVTIVAHAETKREMDNFGPGSAGRLERGAAALRQVLATRTRRDGKPLTAEDEGAVKEALAERTHVIDELNKLPFQSATLTFERDFTVDLGKQEVQVKFLGRGNTSGDAVVYLPAARIVVAGDLVVHPLPSVSDGYPAEWSRTLQALAQLDADTLVPGHGPVLHDKAYLGLLRELFQSAVEQLNAELRRTGPAMFRTLEEVQPAVDLSPFRQRFAGADAELGAAFDETARGLVKLALTEASLR